MSCYSVCFNAEMQHQSRAQQALQYALHPVFNHEEVRVISGKPLEGSKHTKRRNCSSKAVRVMSDYSSDKIKRSVCLRRISQLLSGLLMRGLERDYKSMSYFKHVKINSIAYRRCRWNNQCLRNTILFLEWLFRAREFVIPSWTIFRMRFDFMLRTVWSLACKFVTESQYNKQRGVKLWDKTRSMLASKSNIRLLLVRIIK